MLDKPSYCLAAGLVVLHALGFCLALHFHGIYLKDSFEYLAQADNLKHYGSWYAAPWNTQWPDYFSFRPPLYAIFIVCIKTILNSDYAVLFMQNVLSILNVLLVYRIATHFKLIHKRTVGLILLLLVLFPVQLIMANMIMSEIVFQTLLLLLFHFGLRFWFRPTLLNSLALSILCALLLLTKPVSLFLGVVVFLWMCYCFYVQKTSAKIIVKLLAPFILILFTFQFISLQQKHQTGYYHYSSMLPFNQYKFNARFVLLNQFGEDYAERWADSTKSELNRLDIYEARYQRMKQLGDSVIATYPLTFIRLYVKGVVVFFVDPGRHDLVAFMHQDERNFKGLFYELNTRGMNALTDQVKNGSFVELIFLVLITISNLVVFCLLAISFFSKKVPLWVKLLAGLIIGYIVLATGILGVARYRTAVFPEICLMLLFAIHSWKWFNSEKE